VAGDESNVRAEPKTQATLVKALGPTTPLQVTKFPDAELTDDDREAGRPTSECKGHWAHVEDPGGMFSGWVRSDRLACNDVCVSKDRVATVVTPSRRVRVDFTKSFDVESTFDFTWVAKSTAGAELGRGSCTSISGDAITTPKDWMWGWAECSGIPSFAGATYELTAHGTALTSLVLSPL
jgi:hypothetical protein